MLAKSILYSLLIQFNLHSHPGQPPYYYIGDKQRLAFVRIGNESKCRCLVGG